MPPRRVGGQPFHPIWSILRDRFLRRRVDPHGGRQIRWLWPSVDEALRMRGIGGRQNLLSLAAHGGGLAEVDDGGREKAQAAVSMLLVVPGEKDLPKRPPILDRSEPLRKLGTVLERFELGF